MSPCLLAIYHQAAFEELSGMRRMSLSAPATISQGSISCILNLSAQNICADGAEGTSSSAGPSSSSQQDAHDQSLVDRIAQRSAPLWLALSQCIGRIESGLKPPGGAGDTPASSRVLPPGAAQVGLVRLAAPTSPSCKDLACLQGSEAQTFLV